MKIKKDDRVMVMVGKDKGKIGKVLKVIPKKNRVLVEHANMVKIHARPGRFKSQGGILEKEAPIHISNVMIMCDKCGRPVRIGYRFLEDGKKARACKKCGEILDK